MIGEKGSQGWILKITQTIACVGISTNCPPDNDQPITTGPHIMDNNYYSPLSKRLAPNQIVIRYEMLFIPIYCYTPAFSTFHDLCY